MTDEQEKNAPNYELEVVSEDEEVVENEIKEMLKNTPKRLGGKVAAKSSPKKQVKNLDKYFRTVEGKKIIKRTKDKKLRAELKRKNQKFADAAASAARAEILLTEQTGFLEAEGMEKTYKFSQAELAKNVDSQSASKIFDLTLDEFAPYSLSYTKNGRNLLLGGHKGHFAMIDSLRMGLTTEFHVNETVRDVSFLHNNTLFAAAQKKYAYIYDSSGAEVHCIREMVEPNRLEFLPYHFLLVGIGRRGRLRYQDVTTGNLVKEHNTKLGLCNSMVQNPWNAVINLGHANGLVTMWTPNVKDAVIKIKCHESPVLSLATDQSGKYLVTSGCDRKVKVWDLRTYKELAQYYLSSAGSALSISQSGLLSVGFGSNVNVYKDALIKYSRMPYMTHNLPGKKIVDLAFQPFEDVLSIGHSSGLSNIVIPGAGEANFDTFEANPFEQNKQRRETEVHTLLEKLKPEMITLNPMVIGNVEDDAHTHQKNKALAQKAATTDGNLVEKKTKEKRKMRGKNRPSRRVRKKQLNVVDEEKEKLRQKIEQKDLQMQRERASKLHGERLESAPTALNRFFK